MGVFIAGQRSSRDEFISVSGHFLIAISAWFDPAISSSQSDFMPVTLVHTRGLVAGSCCRDKFPVALFYTMGQASRGTC